jgi:hypothetical protein
MTALTIKQRAKVNAALAIIHSAGHDVHAVQRHASTIMATGRDARYAYETALNHFAAGNPDMLTPLGKITTLIEASDAGTVRQYDRALSAYIETGDEAHINAIAPMVAQDSVALAVRNGEISPEDAAAGNVDWSSLGLAGAPAPAAHASFAFNSPGQPAAIQPRSTPPAAPAPSLHTAAPPAFGNTQVGVGTGLTGIRTGKAAERWAAAPVCTFGRPSPYAGLAPAQIREAMTADMAKQGWQRTDADRAE